MTPASEPAEKSHAFAETAAETAVSAQRSSVSYLAFSFAEVLFTFLLPLAIIFAIVQNSGKMPGKPQP